MRGFKALLVASAFVLCPAAGDTSELPRELLFNVTANP